MFVFNKQRNKKGFIATLLLILATVCMTMVFGLIALEILIRTTSLARVQNAANEAALVYARDMIRLRDQSLSRLNRNSITFQEAGIPYSCIGGCTQVFGPGAAVPGASSLEYLNASQVLLFNLWGERITDPSQVDSVEQFQCYKPHNETRFSKINGSPANLCSSLGKVSSPIMSLNWSFTANPYGTGACCAVGSSNDAEKDFCVDVTVEGRMDPVIAGGLPFLSANGIFSNSSTSANGRKQVNPIQFITVGDFEIHGRAVALRMESITAAADIENIANNLSGETITIEDVPNGSCSVAPPVLIASAMPPSIPISINSTSVPNHIPIPIPSAQIPSIPSFPSYR